MKMKSGLAVSVISFVWLSACPGPTATFTPSKTPAVTAVGTPTGAGVTSMIGASGGTVRSADGKFEVVVPAGALSSNTAISITPITATGPGALLAWRLGPEGTTFAQPVTLRFTPSKADLAGTELGALRIATQTADRKWAVTSTTVGSDSVSTTTPHFSDYSALTGWQLRPGEASVRLSQRQKLNVRYCHLDTDADPVPLVAECQETDLVPILGAWQVNGVTGGNSELGTVTADEAEGTYTAPSSVPSTNPVAVSVEFLPPAKQKVVLIANITIGSPNYRGNASWTTTTNSFRIQASVSELTWVFKRDSGQSAEYTASGSIAFTYTQTNPVCDLVSDSVFISDGSLTVYSVSSPVSQSRYFATLSASKTVSTMCTPAGGGAPIPRTFDVVLFLQVGYCSGEAEPWNDITHLTGSTPCGNNTATTWDWKEVKP